jgi:hypothetical protein
MGPAQYFGSSVFFDPTQRARFTNASGKTEDVSGVALVVPTTPQHKTQMLVAGGLLFAIVPDDTTGALGLIRMADDPADWRVLSSRAPADSAGFFASIPDVLFLLQPKDESSPKEGLLQLIDGGA